MNKLRFARSAATALAVASIGLAGLVTPLAAVDLADCPGGWYWDNQRQDCLLPDLPNDPPNGCLTADGTHLNGTICVN
jgi:23S rRNA C2498 (ribose-2'-O)-methylase RlmM